MKKILAIDTSCDETSVAVTAGTRVLSNKISSQIEFHKKWGGVVPSIARTMHNENIDIVVTEALKAAKTKLEDIDAIAVTQGPGLAIALEVGIRKAKELSLKIGKPLIAINHMEGHIYSTLAQNKTGKPKIEYIFPMLALLVSGGHTELVLMKDHGEYTIVGRTLDDAVGEAYDKVARMLELGYPGGPIIEELAKEGDKDAYPFPIPMIRHRTCDFSYSGLKTSVLYLTQKILTPETTKAERQKITRDIAACFQKAAIESLVRKTEIALVDLKNLEIKDILLAGGVSANMALRKEFRKIFGKEYRLHYPTSKKLYGDNAAMIGVAAYHHLEKMNFANPEDMERLPTLSL
ncbi:MAG: tRNA (adenosine(37)-N6)-threonylcarbamoyltransferase complex transferase subunit TsaD [Candidatus Paceibacterota bacterium]